MTTPLAIDSSSRSAPPLDILQRAGCEITYRARVAAPIILTLKPRQSPSQQIHSERFSIEPLCGMHEYNDSHGNVIHRFKLSEGLNKIRYDSLIWVSSAPENNAGDRPGPSRRRTARRSSAVHAPQPLLRFRQAARFCFRALRPGDPRGRAGPGDLRLGTPQH